jgi:hypothetical protein
MARPATGGTSYKRSKTGKLYPRANSGDWRFGHICPQCAGPKTDQALRCRRCAADDSITTGLYRKGVMRGQRFLHASHLENYHGPGNATR